MTASKNVLISNAPIVVVGLSLIDSVEHPFNIYARGIGTGIIIPEVSPAARRYDAHLEHLAVGTHVRHIATGFIDIGNVRQRVGPRAYLHVSGRSFPSVLDFSHKLWNSYFRRSRVLTHPQPCTLILSHPSVLLSQLVPQQHKLLRCGNSRCGRVNPSAVGTRTDNPGLSVHFQELLVDEVSGQGSNKDRYSRDPNSQQAHTNSSPLKGAKFVIFCYMNKKWLVSAAMLTFSGFLMWVCGDILLGGWSGHDRINLLFRQFFGRILTDRERVLLALASFLATVRLGFQVVINVSQ